MTISLINNNELGLSVRTKLNQVITIINETGNKEGEIIPIINNAITVVLNGRDKVVNVNSEIDTINLEFPTAPICESATINFYFNTVSHSISPPSIYWGNGLETVPIIQTEESVIVRLKLWNDVLGNVFGELDNFKLSNIGD